MKDHGPIRMRGPIEDSNECMRFLGELPITPADRVMIYSQNADQLGISGSGPAGELASRNQQT